MRASRGRSEHLSRRLVGALLALALLAAGGPGAGAVTKKEVEAAKAKVAQLQRQIRAQNARLDGLEAEAWDLATQVYEAQAAWEATTQELIRIRDRLDSARERYERLRARLDGRAREAYMSGPGSGIEFVLGATSLTDLSDRIEFVGAVAESDAELANDVENLRNSLEADEAEKERLQARQARELQELEVQKAALDAKWAEQQRVLRRIESLKAQAVERAKKLSREYQRQLRERFSGPFHKGTFKVCPVGQPRAVSNSFGAPRVGHLHAGVDIFAPYGTPIYAPFDGTARASTSSLGGHGVYVDGSEGYVFNAHLSQPAHNLGPVQAGEVIGYTGTSGNAQGTSPHNHFEWHPNVIPSNWPASPYGYSVLGDAVNPYPILVGVC